MKLENVDSLILFNRLENPVRYIYQSYYVDVVYSKAIPIN